MTPTSTASAMICGDVIAEQASREKAPLRHVQLSEEEGGTRAALSAIVENG